MGLCMWRCVVSVVVYSIVRGGVWRSAVGQRAVAGQCRGRVVVPVKYPNGVRRSGLPDATGCHSAPCTNGYGDGSGTTTPQAATQGQGWSSLRERTGREEWAQPFLDVIICAFGSLPNSDIICASPPLPNAVIICVAPGLPWSCPGTDIMSAGRPAALGSLPNSDIICASSPSLPAPRLR